MVGYSWLDAHKPLRGVITRMANKGIKMMKLPINYRQSHWSVRKKAREQYIREQNGLCYHCKAPLNESPPKKIISLEINKRLFPEGFFNYPVHLHHCHKTDMTIGAVHSICNAVLWQYFGE